MTSATADVQYATHMCDRQRWSGYVTNVHLGITRASVLYAEESASVMRIIVLHARGWRRIEMGVVELLIWGQAGQICSMRRRGTLCRLIDSTHNDPNYRSIEPLILNFLLARSADRAMNWEP